MVRASMIWPNAAERRLKALAGWMRTSLYTLDVPHSAWC